jgi:hypothetical protein
MRTSIPVGWWIRCTAVATAGALRGGDRLLHVRRIEIELDLLGLGQHRHRRRRSVHASLGLGRGHALHLMRSALEGQVGEGPRALEGEDRLLDAARVAGARIEHLDAPAAIRREALVHLDEIAREESRLVAPDAGADLEDHRADRVLVRGHELLLRGFERLRRRAAEAGKLLPREHRELGIGFLGETRRVVEFAFETHEAHPSFGERLHRRAADRDRLHTSMVRGDLRIGELLAHQFVLPDDPVERAAEVLVDVERHGAGSLRGRGATLRQRQRRRRTGGVGIGRTGRSTSWRTSSCRSSRRRTSSGTARRGPRRR